MERLAVHTLTYQKAIKSLSGHKGKINTVAFTPDGRCILSVGSDRTVKLWDLSPGECLKTFDRHPACWHMRDMRGLIQASNREFSYNDAVGDLAVARTFDPETRTFFGHADAVTALAVSRCGRYVVSGSRDGTVRLWDLPSGTCLWIFGGQDGGSGFWIHDVAVTPDGRRILSLTNKIHVWRLSSKRLHRYFWGVLRENPLFVIDDESLSVSCVTLGQNSKNILVTTDRDRTVSLFQIRTGKRQAVFDLENRMATGLSAAPNGNLLAVGTRDGAILIFDLRRQFR